MNVPAQITQGDTARWSESIANYLSTDGWELELVLVRDGAAPVTIDATGQADGGWELELDATTTAALDVATYTWSARVSNSGDRHTITGGQLQVLQDIAEAGSTGYDGRSWAQKTLEAVEAALLGVASKRQSAHTVNLPDGGSRQIQYLSQSELLVVRDKLRAEVARERAQQQIEDNGYTGAGVVRARFR